MKLLNSKIFTALVSVLVLLLTFSLIDITSHRSIVDREVKNTEAKIKEVQNDTNYLSKFLAYFQSSAFLEKEARLKLNYKAQGEEVVFIYKDNGIKNGTDAINLEELLARIPNYKKWFLYLLGY